MTPALQVLRPHLRLDADSQIRVVFLDTARIPVFECDPCEELLAWNNERGWWECPQCAYEMTPLEAEALLDLSIARLVTVRTGISKMVRRGWWARLGRWFDRLRRS